MASSAGHTFAGGVVLYDGGLSAGFGDGFCAVPMGHTGLEVIGDQGLGHAAEEGERPASGDQPRSRNLELELPSAPKAPKPVLW